GRAQGERYFFIPALGRHRGVAHFYLECFNTGDFNRDLAYAKAFGEAVIDTYTSIVSERIAGNPPADGKACALQLAYHTLYLFQVLTLDQGTTSGLLVHDQNDVGILGSLPSHVDVDLLKSWAKAVEAPQQKLVESIVDILGGSGVVEVDRRRKIGLAKVVRSHYRKYPEAIKLQARGEITPPTVANHA
ncbi:MAG TPA: coproporphyrinogen III oxidase, partial [Campylobacteraceae bacterium]|nr:coproporphyrinogen III oxidase [Campylobacteraceae bacterium]